MLYVFLVGAPDILHPVEFARSAGCPLVDTMRRAGSFGLLRPSALVVLDALLFQDAAPARPWCASSSSFHADAATGRRTEMRALAADRWVASFPRLRAATLLPWCRSPSLRCGLSPYVSCPRGSAFRRAHGPLGALALAVRAASMQSAYWSFDLGPATTGASLRSASRGCRSPPC